MGGYFRFRKYCLINYIAGTQFQSHDLRVYLLATPLSLLDLPPFGFQISKSIQLKFKILQSDKKRMELTKENEWEEKVKRIGLISINGKE